MLRFTLVLLSALIVIGGLHYSYFLLRDLPFSWVEFLYGYGINFVMALIVYASMLYLAKKKSTYLGFLFLTGSAFKFAIYFLLIDPVFRADGKLSFTEFFIFFIPYLICLTIETLAVIQLLKKIDK
ncbi:MAG: hypothetical protein HKN89_09640 [Eudoraea sp.]|nr:hypothetical protein [Eudoraea sp.]